MTNQLIETIVSEDDTFRNRSINILLEGKNKDTLLRLAEEVEAFRISSNNLYHKVRSSLFLFVLLRCAVFVGQDFLEIRRYLLNGNKKKWRPQW
jgi:hypothetical protein